jgi:2-methylcitrate dehydratase PrpD
MWPIDEGALEVRNWYTYMLSIVDFVRTFTWGAVPADVQHIARRCFLDLAGGAAAGFSTLNGMIVREHAAIENGPGRYGARLMMDGRRTSLSAAAMAGAANIDAFNSHDGLRITKGHAGCAILPSLLAFEDERATSPDIAELMMRFVVGYEVSLRAGIAQKDFAESYLGSGSWNGIGVAALGARALALDAERTLHALGAAEFYAPRCPMGRLVEHPTMLKDGATFGAHTGVTAVLLAAAGFTGAPSELVLNAPVVWMDLGSRWFMRELYFKPWPIVRWSQPAVAAASSLLGAIAGRSIEAITIETFGAAARLAAEPPVTTEQAQYSLVFPVAAVLATGEINASTITSGLGDQATLGLMQRTSVRIDPALDAEFPARRRAAITVQLFDGEILKAGPQEAPGEPDAPLTDSELHRKFWDSARPLLGIAGTERALDLIWNALPSDPVRPLLDALLGPAPARIS